MKTTTLSFALIALGALGALACTDHGTEPRSNVAQEANPAGNVALEAALADIEIGRESSSARAALEGLLAGQTLSTEDAVRVNNALAKSYESVDKERAASLLEAAIALGDESADKRLFALLAGHAEPHRARQDDPKLPPMTFALARYFPTPSADRKIQVDIVTFGRYGHYIDVEDPGTWRIGGALRQKSIEACGYCDDPKEDIHTHHSDHRFWSSIPRESAQLEKAVVVLYVEPESMVPARYGKWLATPQAEIQAAIDRGEGLVAVKERAGAPPIITIAAPRAAQLMLVEKAFSLMAEVPTRPVTVKLPEGLGPLEVLDGLRLKGASATCTKELLKQDPTATWSTDVSLTIIGSGAVSEIAFSGDAPKDIAFRTCLERYVSAAHFPAWSKNPQAKSRATFHMGHDPARDRREAKAPPATSASRTLHVSP